MQAPLRVASWFRAWPQLLGGLGVASVALSAPVAGQAVRSPRAGAVPGAAAPWPGTWIALRPGRAGLATEDAGAAAPLPRLTAGRVRLDLNLAAFELRALDATGHPLAAWPVAIGMRGHQTPRGEFSLTTVTLNPWWHPPDSPWAADDEVTPPGPRSPVGRLKATFAPLLHFHGTPQLASIGSAASHGCVRLGPGDIVQLGRLLIAQDSLLREQHGPDPIPERLDSWRRTTRWELARPVPVRIRYSWLEHEPDGTFRLYPDPYGRLTRAAADSLADLITSVGAGPLTGAQVQRLVREAARRQSWLRVTPAQLARWAGDPPAGPRGAVATDGGASGRAGPTGR